MDNKYIPLPEEIAPLISKHHPYGSRHVCPKGAAAETDSDWLVIPKPYNNSGELAQKLKELGFTSEGHEGSAGEGFRSFRKGLLNIVVAENIGFYLMSRTATELCRELGLTNKEHRILVHDVVVRGVEYCPTFGWG